MEALDGGHDPHGVLLSELSWMLWVCLLHYQDLQLEASTPTGSHGLARPVPLVDLALGRTGWTDAATRLEEPSASKVARTEGGRFPKRSYVRLLNLADCDVRSSVHEQVKSGELYHVRCRVLGYGLLSRS